MVKRIFSFVLILVAMFSFAGCGTAPANANVSRELHVADEDIALITLYSDNGKGESTLITRNYGHAFFAITNVGDSNFTVGDMVVIPNETITIGLWSIYEHFGVWYNVESNYIKEHNKYADRVSITIGIDMDDINKITEVIKHNNAWTPLYNCSKFALDAWNMVALDSEKIPSKLIMSPGYLVEEILKFKGYEKAKEIVTSTLVRYHGEA